MLRQCIALAFLLLFSSELYGTHAQGVDVTYTWVSGNTYILTVNFYRDCDGVAAPAGVTLDISSVSGCAPDASVTLTQSGPGTEVSPLCPAQLGNSTCSGGALPGVEQYVYTATYTFPATCPDWVIAWEHCCRNNAITNLVSPGTQSMYVEATMNNTNNYNNSSPIFTTLPVPFICANQLFCYNHGAVDADGDSLGYSLVNALTAGATNINYNAPNTPTYPITDIAGSITFDPITGSMCVTPNGPQVAVVTISVEEYRNGVLIGSTMRDLQIVVQNCSNQQPGQSSGGIINNVGGTVIDSNSVEICPTELMSFDIVFSDPNLTDVITLTTNLAAAIPGATFNQSGTNPVTFQFSWTPTIADIGFHFFTITIQDDGCPILGSQVFQYDIEVLPQTDAGPDLSYCVEGGPVQLNVTGGNTFVWNVITGDGGSLSCTNCQSPNVNPNQPTTYQVISDLPGLCKNRDTVFVDTVPGFALTMPPRDTICRNGSTFLLPTISPGTYAPYTYIWTPSSTLSSNTAANPLASPQVTTNYVVTVTSALGCRVSDSVQIDVIGVAPIVDAGLDQTVCPGVMVPLTGAVVGQCGTMGAPCTASADTSQIGFGATPLLGASPFLLAVTTPFSTRRQWLFSKAELDAAGMTGGANIKGMALNITNVGSAPNDNPDIQISMGCTAFPNFRTTAFSQVWKWFCLLPPTRLPAAGAGSTLHLPANMNGTGFLVWLSSFVPTARQHEIHLRSFTLLPQHGRIHLEPWAAPAALPQDRSPIRVEMFVGLIAKRPPDR